MLALAALPAGCTSELGGRASFPVVSRGDPYGGGQLVTSVDEQRCNYGLLFLFGWGEDANHEALVTDLLEKYDGDAIVDAELTYSYIPAIVYTQTCARITGKVVRIEPSARRARTAATAPLAEEEP